MSTKWPKVRLGEVLTVCDTSAPVARLGEVKLAGVYSFGRGLFKRGPITPAETSYKTYNRLVTDDFVISQPKAWEGALARVTPEFDGWYLSPVFPTFRANRNHLDPRFLEWFCRQQRVWSELVTKSRGIGARRESVSPQQFLSLEIPLPPLAEQQRIVARIEELAEQIDEARALRQQIDRDIDKLPWVTARSHLKSLDVPLTPLSQWVDIQREGIQTGPFGAQLSSNDFRPTGKPILTIGNLQYDGLVTDNLRFVSEAKASTLDRYQIREGDILIARMGTVGRCCVTTAKAAGWLINYHIIRVALDQTKVDPQFIHWTIRASAEIADYLSDKIRGATRQGINSKIIGGFPCRVPPIAEQRRIADELDALQAEAKKLENLQNDIAPQLAALLPSILNKAFQGRL